MKPAFCPSAYQPTARPMQPAMNEPATPSNIVTMMPPGSLPGMINLASAPTIKPTMSIHRTCMRCLLSKIMFPIPHSVQMPCHIGATTVGSVGKGCFGDLPEHFQKITGRDEQAPPNALLARLLRLFIIEIFLMRSEF